MGRRKRPDGPCHICGRVCQLSWEHVPPESAFNDRPIVRAVIDKVLTGDRWDGRSGEKVQRGSGGFTLCERCNNDTGSWYGAEYAEWANQGLELLARIDARYHTENDRFCVPFRGYPARFLKQVITMFFSVNECGFADQHPELVQYVLDKRRRCLPPRYGVDLVLVRGAFARSSGVSGRANFANGQVEISSEVAHFPFAVRLILNADEHLDRVGALERFAEYAFEDRREVWIFTTAGDIATAFPGDYRSQPYS